MNNYDFTDEFEALYKHLEGMQDIAESMFLEINHRDQIEVARVLLEEIDGVKKLKTAAERLREGMEELRDRLGISGGSLNICNSKNKGGLRTIKIEITDGMIRQSLLSMTDAKKRGLVKVGEQFQLKMPGGLAFETELIEPGNKLRERGRIKAFYDEHKIKPGDFVVLKEIEPGTWDIGFQHHGEALDDIFK